MATQNYARLTPEFLGAVKTAIPRGMPSASELLAWYEEYGSAQPVCSGLGLSVSALSRDYGRARKGGEVPERVAAAIVGWAVHRGRGQVSAAGALQPCPPPENCGRGFEPFADWAAFARAAFTGLTAWHKPGWVNRPSQAAEVARVVVRRAGRQALGRAAGESASAEAAERAGCRALGCTVDQFASAVAGWIEVSRFTVTCTSAGATIVLPLGDAAAPKVRAGLIEPWRLRPVDLQGRSATLLLVGLAERPRQGDLSRHFAKMLLAKSIMWSGAALLPSFQTDPTDPVVLSVRGSADNATRLDALGFRATGGVTPESGHPIVVLEPEDETPPDEESYQLSHYDWMTSILRGCQKKLVARGTIAAR